MDSAYSNGVSSVSKDIFQCVKTHVQFSNKCPSHACSSSSALLQEADKSKDLCLKSPCWLAHLVLCYMSPSTRTQRPEGLGLWYLVHGQLFAILWTIAHQAPLFTEFPRHEYWSGLPFPIPGDLPDAEIKPCFPCLLHWLADSLPLCHLGILILEIVFHYFKVKVILPFPTSLLCQHKFSYLGYFLLFTNLTPSSPS